MKTVAIIPAGGAGKRLKTHVAKQYLMLNQLPVLIHTLQVFQKSKIINDIVLVLPPDDLASVRQKLIDKYELTKVTSIIAGGKERQDSVRNGLAAIDGKCDFVLIHDAVRPLITEKMIRQVAAAAKATGAASLGVKAKDTIKETGKYDIVSVTIPRHNLWLTQTPQAFKFEILKKAYKKAYNENFYGTDDASLVERIGVKVKMIAGSYDNIKITTPEDLVMARALLKNKSGGKMQTCIGCGYDSHSFVTGRKLILGGVEIPFKQGLQGHSDADALIHAICDALLGAAGSGDIGRHFPDTDPQYKDISSRVLLGRVRNVITAKGFTINNIDATIIMEKPKVTSFIDKMITNIAKVLKIPADDINIKAKTNEGMGFVGRGEGIAVSAVVTLNKE
ncbi:MAG: bifunctional 2-C-methyl-D-erythritol 4-phosphate cytidylyltransferase/2-C-methyl-D-erythritol 2,4-cyclodiphosphate synthase [Deltaproteobacteria bacterium HGW-Deltaproteobacteria-2]|jgi:2-C-methyl-D-erythritol 4-phosphate cytidylyltransferase/2-C-methyl-D-erythritol 2,4-cyclodiphosphate synthase|nr:MAG: bifunctional 2-C-methyl-D-erythritol 4-phosphate cytidylyltransferase/2-C-methyl-D-erythritol 2,4-cyclodiphosphate synthase [Deltaproteobacteria bacterium HGW-Deltaproteobacteria-2]